MGDPKSFAGFSLVELMVVISLLSMLSLVVYREASGSWQEAKLASLAEELQTVVNILEMNRRYGTSFDVDAFNSIRGDMVVSIGGGSGNAFSSVSVELPSEGNILQVYGVKSEPIYEGEKGTPIVETELTFFSRPTDTLTQLYLADPYVRRLTQD